MGKKLVLISVLIILILLFASLSVWFYLDWKEKQKRELIKETAIVNMGYFIKSDFLSFSMACSDPALIGNDRLSRKQIYDRLVKDSIDYNTSRYYSGKDLDDLYDVSSVKVMSFKEFRVNEPQIDKVSLMYEDAYFVTMPSLPGSGLEDFLAVYKKFEDKWLIFAFAQ